MYTDIHMADPYGVGVVSIHAHPRPHAHAA